MSHFLNVPSESLVSVAMAPAFRCIEQIECSQVSFNNGTAGRLFGTYAYAKGESQHSYWYGGADGKLDKAGFDKVPADAKLRGRPEAQGDLDGRGVRRVGRT